MVRIDETGLYLLPHPTLGYPLALRSGLTPDHDGRCRERLPPIFVGPGSQMLVEEGGYLRVGVEAVFQFG